MTSPGEVAARELMEQIASLHRRMDTMERGSRATQLGHSSLDVNSGRGYIPIYDGEVEKARLGRLPDGSIGVATANELEPPAVPQPPIVEATYGGANVTVSDLSDTIKYSFGFVKVWVNEEHVGNIIRIPGSLIVGPLDPDLTHSVRLSAVNTSGVESAKSREVTIKPLSVVDGIGLEGITSTLIADDAITTPKIMAKAITSLLIAARAINADHIKAGAVTADKLEAILAIVNRMVAGNPLANRVEISAAGIEQYSALGQLLIQIGSTPGSGTTNIITVVDPNDPTQALATLASDGTLTTTGLIANGPIMLNGIPLDQVLNSQSWGLQAYGSIDVDSNATTSRIGVYELAFDAKANRTYRFASSSFFIASAAYDQPGAGSLEIRYTTDGSRPTINSALMGDASTHDDNAYKENSGAAKGQSGFQTTTVGTNGVTSTDSNHFHNYGGNHTHGIPGHDHETTFRMAQVATKVESLKVFSSNVRVRVLFCLYAYYGNIRLDDPNGDAGIQFFVEDIGPRVDATGGVSVGSGSGSGGSGTTTKTYSSTFTSSWSGIMGPSSKLNNSLVQGTAGDVDQASMIGFDSATIVSDLSGASILKVELYLYAKSWDYSTGGTVVVGTHNQVVSPNAYSSISRSVHKFNLGRPEGRWVVLPLSIGLALQSAGARGLVLDSRLEADSTDAVYKGIFAGQSELSRRPQLRITYNK